MIKRIVSIKNLAVFSDFNWARSVRDKGNNVSEFKKINIFYGRNYSGKTSLSRIMRALETKTLSEKFQSPEFIVDIKDEANVSQSSLGSHSQVIRVFNEDFVRDNLQFIVDPEAAIKSFAILGDNNNKIEAKIREYDTELGSKENQVGLLGQLEQTKQRHSLALSNFKNAESSLEEKLKNKANQGIKEDKIFGDPRYNILKIKSDIVRVQSEQYELITDNVVEELVRLLKEEPKPTSPSLPPLSLVFSAQALKLKALVEKKITASEPIKELLDSPLLQTWVRTGRELHEGKRESCGFCGNRIPENLWDRLDQHFSKESEALLAELKISNTSIETESKRIEAIPAFETGGFYSIFSARLAELNKRLGIVKKEYQSSLMQLQKLVSLRVADIFTPIPVPPVIDVSTKLEKIFFEYEELRVESNGLTESLSKKQETARASLRLNSVSRFMKDINYDSELKNIETLRLLEVGEKETLSEALSQIDLIEKEISALKVQLNDEAKGADKVNRYLNDFFGYDALSLRAEKAEIEFRFEVIRNGEKAHHLSEGECSLISFCYFMARLDDTLTREKKPIVWIDDPISSLDVNHIFFVYSLIQAEIIKKGEFSQLFVSTHNLDFLKYLKRLTGFEADKNYFILERGMTGSSLKIMPDYLKKYVTEFNYLFHQIYRCATAEVTSDSDYDCFYSFGNNARKFLEALLFYKYPDTEKNEIKMRRFFGNDDVASTLIDRLNNEYSHIEGTLERGTIPIDVPEMKTTAEYILKKISEKDRDQYLALLASIGVESLNEVAPVVPLQAV